jgi:hypothetical protein
MRDERIEKVTESYQSAIQRWKDGKGCQFDRYAAASATESPATT